MKGKIFAIMAVFAMVAICFSANALALETNPAQGSTNIMGSGPTHWYTALEGDAMIIGGGKPVEGTAYTGAYQSCDVPCSTVWNFIKVEPEEDAYWYILNIEEVTGTSNTLAIEFAEGRLHGKLISTETTVHMGDYMGDSWSVTSTTYTVADMQGILTFDGMKVKLQDMSGTVTHSCWYQTSTLPDDILHDHIDDHIGPLLV